MSIWHKLTQYSDLVLQKGLENHKVLCLAAATYVIYKTLKPLAYRRHAILVNKPNIRYPQGIHNTTDEFSGPDQSGIDDTLFPQYYLNRQGLHLFVRRWPIPNPRGLILISHGMAEHIGRYEALALFLNRAGYSVAGIDHQGHGQSEGDRVYCEKFDDFAHDFADFINYETLLFQQHAGKVPLFLFGHSLGGLILTRLLLERTTLRWPIAGVVYSGPALSVNPQLANPILRIIGTIVSQVLPKCPVASLDSNSISSIPDVIQRYKADPLVAKEKILANFGIQILLACENVIERHKEIDVPTLVMHGTLDSIIPVEGSRRFIKEISSKDRTFIQFLKSHHEILNDVERKDVLKTMIEWILLRTVHDDTRDNLKDDSKDESG